MINSFHKHKVIVGDAGMKEASFFLRVVVMPTSIHKSDLVMNKYKLQNLFFFLLCVCFSFFSFFCLFLFLFLERSYLNSDRTVKHKCEKNN